SGEPVGRWRASTVLAVGGRLFRVTSCAQRVIRSLIVTMEGAAIRAAACPPSPHGQSPGPVSPPRVPVTLSAAIVAGIVGLPGGTTDMGQPGGLHHPSAHTVGSQPASPAPTPVRPYPASTRS